MENIAKALVKAQLELKNPEQNKEGYGYKYSDLASLIDLTKPVLQKNGLAITQLACDDGNGRVGVETILMHESGESLKSTLTLPIPEMKGNTATQQAGAAITYARRYAYSAILNITSEEDTDASNKKSASSKASTKSNGSESNTTKVVDADQPGTKLCEQHNVEMKARNGKYGLFHSHAQQDPAGNWEYCNGQGFPSEQAMYEEEGPH